MGIHGLPSQDGFKFFLPSTIMLCFQTNKGLTMYLSWTMLHGTKGPHAQVVSWLKQVLLPNFIVLYSKDEQVLYKQVQLADIPVEAGSLVPCHFPSKPGESTKGSQQLISPPVTSSSMTASS
jgi:hypothetical protein